MNHRKFKRLVALAQLEPAHARGYLELMWEAAYESGDPYLGDAHDVELAAGWSGPPGELARALAECGGQDKHGFIEETAPGSKLYLIHDLFDHAPDYVRKRLRREQQRRESGRAFSEAAGWTTADSDRQTADSDRSVTAERRQTAENGSSLAPAPAPTLAPALAPEKRLAPQPAAAPPERPELVLVAQTVEADPPQVVIWIPIKGALPATPTRGPVQTGEHGTEYGVTTAYLAELKESFPAVDVEQVLREIRRWNIRKPQHRKTYPRQGSGGVLDHIENWMSGEQNKARVGGARHTDRPLPAGTRNEHVERARERDQRMGIRS